jgi:hypothetical protein
MSFHTLKESRFQNCPPRFEFIYRRSFLPEVSRGSATAKLENHIVVLRADVDLSGVSPGSYFLGVRQPGLEWTRFSIRLL